jgi:F420-dependent oxidoreductase-like protein
MTAAGLDYVSGGRFTLGLGASGPQVIEGFHGVPYKAPLQRTREVIDICRMVWRREKLQYAGQEITLPLEGGTGLGKPLKLINHPVRDRIPIMLAALGPKNVALAAEVADGWEPVFFYPEKAASVFGPSLAAGRAKRDPALGELQIVVDTTLAITSSEEEEAALLAGVRHELALYVGGMGARGRNFYNDLAGRYGFEEAAKTVQDLYLSGRKDEAAAALPDELVRGVSLIGPAGRIAERVAALAEAGATTINARPLAPTHERRLRDVERLKEVS